MGHATVSDMNVRALLSLAACGAGLLLSGCGGGTDSPTVKPVASALAGNWLIVGPMPTEGLETPLAFRLALTFDVNGNNLVVAGFGNDFCGNNSESSFAFGSVATGTVANDGSFTLQSPASVSGLPTTAVSIKGTLPTANDGQWPGSYTASFATPFTPTCASGHAGTFTATSFPLVNGTYVGTGSVETTGGVTMPLTFQVSLQQGGTLTNPVNGATSPIFSNAVLTGGIRVQGSPCFSSGVTSATPPSGVAGNVVNAAFTMDDGSTLNLQGALTDLTEGQIATNFVLVSGGKCGVGFLYQLAGLDQQR
jgi:hypothetical protein